MLRKDHQKDDQKFQFAAKLERGAFMFEVSVPQRITKALGKKGPIPVLAKVPGAAEFLVSLVPAGNGRHVLRLNTKTRKAANLDEGDLVKVQITVPSAPIEVPFPADLREELKTENVFEAFKALPVGKQNHIIQWIEQAAQDKTRQKRIQMAIEVAYRKRERSVDKKKVP